GAGIPPRGRGGPEAGTIAPAIAAAHAAGAKPDWEAFFAPAAPRALALPTYPFQRKRYWLASPSAAQGDMSAAGQAPADHPLLGAVVELPAPEGEGLLPTRRPPPPTPPRLKDHAPGQARVLPRPA